MQRNSTRANETMSEQNDSITTARTPSQAIRLGKRKRDHYTCKAWYGRGFGVVFPLGRRLMHSAAMGARLARSSAVARCPAVAALIPKWIVHTPSCGISASQNGMCNHHLRAKTQCKHELMRPTALEQPTPRLKDEQRSNDSYRWYTRA